MKNKNMTGATAQRTTSSVRLAVMVSALMLMASGSFAAIQTTVGHNAGELASLNFTFTNVPPPSRNDAATTAKFIILSGEAEGSVDSLDALHDRKLPTQADAPAESLFFAAGTGG